MSSKSVQRYLSQLKIKSMKRVFKYKACHPDAKEMISSLSQKFAPLALGIDERPSQGAFLALQNMLRAIEVEPEDYEAAQREITKGLKAFRRFMRDNKDIESQALRALNLREVLDGNNVIWKDSADIQVRDTKTGNSIPSIKAFLEEKFNSSTSNQPESRFLDQNTSVDLYSRRNRFYGFGDNDLSLPS